MIITSSPKQIDSVPSGGLSASAIIATQFTIDADHHLYDAHAATNNLPVGGGSFNNEWWAYLQGRSPESLNRREIYDYALRMMEKYNFDGLQLHVYRKPHIRSDLSEILRN